ncbi:MAG: HAMP domain-containing sensor histidine kinase [Coriobacteriia bacterium]|nr:HAMP domain-containing sensor histidine kinase [Coriobacteriia bacterium]
MNQNPHDRLSLRSILLLSLLAITIFTTAIAVILVVSNINLSRYVTALIILLLSLVVIFIVVITNKISEPFEELARRARNYSEGELINSFNLQSKASREALEISAAFNRIARTMHKKDVKAREDDLRQQRFLSDVSHELKTPLTAIKGTAETLLDNPDIPPEDVDHFLEIIILESDRLVRLAKDLITMQRMDDLARSSTQSILSPKVMIKEVVERLEILLENRNVGVEIRGDAPDVYMNKDAFVQIMFNLLENGSRYAPPQSLIKIMLSAQGNMSVIKVTDEGPGLGDIDPSLLFQRFYKADFSRQKQAGAGGTGLGLAIVKQIVEVYKGDVFACNEEGAGASFVVSLPIAKSEDRAPSPEKAPQKP